MTDDITIMMNEVNNDGGKIHLYFNPSFGQYVAYGISGYVASNCVWRQGSGSAMGIAHPGAGEEGIGLYRERRNLDQ